MTTPDLEAAARAMFMLDHDHIDTPERNELLWRDDVSTKDLYIELARACLSAIRVPSEAMYRAAYEAMVPAGDAKACWDAMIDAILADKTGERE